MMTTFGLLGLALVLAVVSAINAIGTHYAAKFAEADCPDYKETFVNIFYGYMVFFGVVFVLKKLNMFNNFFIMVAWLAVIAWVVYRLAGKLGIEGNNNIIIFVGMSFFFNMIIGSVLGVLF